MNLKEAAEKGILLARGPLRGRVGRKEPLSNRQLEIFRKRPLSWGRGGGDPIR